METPLVSFFLFPVTVSKTPHQSNLARLDERVHTERIQTLRAHIDAYTNSIYQPLFWPGLGQHGWKGEQERRARFATLPSRAVRPVEQTFRKRVVCSFLSKSWPGIAVRYDVTGCTCPATADIADPIFAGVQCSLSAVMRNKWCVQDPILF